MRRIVFSLWLLLFASNVQADFTNVVVGTTANDRTGDDLRTAFQKLNYAANLLKTNLTTVSNLAIIGGGATKLDTNNGTAYGLGLGDATPSRAAAIGADGKLTNATPTVAELNYVAGVTSEIQAQIDAKAAGANLTTVSNSVNGKLDTNGATAYRLTIGDLTASRAAAIGAAGNLTNATATLAELDFLSGVTSAVQTQINSANAASALKLPTSHSGATNLIAYGATAGGNADTAVAAFVASTAREVVIRNAFTLANDTTIPSGYRFKFEQGGSLSIASGKTLTINGEVEAGNYQIFSGAGTITFTTSSPNIYSNVRWFGALDSLTRSDDNLSAFNKTIASIPNSAASRGMFVYTPSGHYWSSAGLTIPGNLDMRGDGPETTVLRANFSTSGTLIALGGNTELRLWNIKLLNDPAAVSTNTGVSIGVSGAALSKVEMHNVSFSQWSAKVLAVTNVGYAKFFECSFLNNQNSATWNGTGTSQPAIAFYLGGTSVIGNGNYVTGVHFNNCRFSGNDQTMNGHYVSSPVFNGCWIESEGSRLTTSAPSTIDLGSTEVDGFVFTGNYVEANNHATNEATLKLANVRGAVITGNKFVNHFGGVQKGESAIIITNGSEGVFIMGNGFSGTRDKFIKNYSANTIIAWPNSYDAAFGLTGTLTNYSQISPYMLGTNFIVFGGVDTGPVYPTLYIPAPTIPSFANATHTHQNSAGGGTLDAAAIAAGTLVAARMPALTGPVSTSAGSVATTLAVTIPIAIGDETTVITAGTAKVTFRMPHAMTVTAVRASLTTASSSGLPTFDINEAGVSILSTKLTLDVGEKTSVTAATAAVISDASLADDAEITIDLDVAGTGAAGPKIYLIGTR